MQFTQFRRAALIAAAIAFAVSGASAQSAKRPQKQYTIEQFMNTVSVTGASFSPDESRILFSSNKTGIWNAYTIPVTGGEWTPVTTSTTDSTFAVAYFPNDDRILFTRDQGGNELNHLYVRTADGEERDLTPGEKLKASFNGFTPDGSAFCVQSNKRDPKYFRHLPLRREDVRADALLPERRLLPDGRLRRWQVGVAGEGDHDDRIRTSMCGTLTRRP